MLNSKSIVSNHINAVTGNICKTYRESFFVRFHLKSNFAEKILDYNSRCKIGYRDEDVVVIQMVVCGDMEVLCELIKKEDYDRYFEGR